MKRDGHQDADTATYRSDLGRALDAASPSAARRLEALRDAATARTDGVSIDVFPDQVDAASRIFGTGKARTCWRARSSNWPQRSQFRSSSALM
ncbi:MULTISPECIES: DUF6389 family protein [Streptomyces]|uniref:DUF6389 family protein n=1 Tax=Streptomyces TaxID=1883 RepID=UPI001F0BA8A8|nr:MULTISPECIES: DUF6389 family protein [Streptomyces]